MELLYPPSQLPYAELAVIAQTQGEKGISAISLKVSEDVSQPTLKVQQDGRTFKVTGTSSILRYFARLASAQHAYLYNESNASSSSLLSSIDAILDACRLADAKSLEAAVPKSNTFLYSADQPTIADFALWSALKATNAGNDQIKNWVAHMDALPACVAALKSIPQSNAGGSSKGLKEITDIKAVPGSDPVNNVLDKFKCLIATQVSEISGADLDKCFGFIEAAKGVGDLAIPVPPLKLGGNPSAHAADICAKFQPNNYITKAEANGIFMCFTIDHAILNQLVIQTIWNKRESYGENVLGKGKKVVVEFSSPNIAKPFHAGHLRSTIIGAFIANLYKMNGWDVVTMNYLGDWGKQYGILAIGFEKYGNEEKLLEDPIKHLYDVYVQINKDAEEEGSDIHDKARAYFKRMEDGDEEALNLWRKFRDLSIVKYKETYARLNVHFDVYSGESQVTEGMDRALKKLHEQNLLVESDGALMVDLKREKLNVALVQKKDGTTLYITRDIGAAMERYEKYKFDKMIYVVASQQDLHLKQLFTILDKMGYDWAKKCEHVNFGMVTGMSTRKGTAVFLDQILADTKESMHNVMQQNAQKYAQIEDPEQVADDIGIAAVKIQDFAAKRVKNYDFNWNRMFSFEGDTGPYLQYAHARLCSVERNAPFSVTLDVDFTLLKEKEADDLLLLCSQWPDQVKQTLKSVEPCNIVIYAFKVAHAVSAAWEKLWVVNQERPIAEARLLMYWTARVVLGNAMRLLGIKPLERM